MSACTSVYWQLDHTTCEYVPVACTVTTPHRGGENGPHQGHRDFGISWTNGAAQRSRAIRDAEEAKTTARERRIVKLTGDLVRAESWVAEAEEKLQYFIGLRDSARAGLEAER